MITHSELLRVVLAPLVVSAVIAGIGRSRGWAWAMPLAAGAGFAAGYALIGVPRLPPIDGNDWLFWLIAPVTVFGIAASLAGSRWPWLLGAAGAVLVAVVIALPLLGGAVTVGAIITMSLTLAAAAAVLCFAGPAAEPRVGSWAVAAALCAVTGAAAVVVMSSGLRILGVYGVAAATALVPVAALIGRLPSRGVVVTSVPLLAGLLVASWYYAYPGVSLLHFAVLIAAQLLLVIGAVLPFEKRPWLRGAVAVALVAIAVGAVTIPTALTAKKQAESTQDDLYEEYYR